MKVFASIFVLIFGLLLSSSSSSSSCDNSENRQVERPNSAPVLEMSQEFRGLWAVTGKILEFRLYDNGLVEFETIDNNKKDRNKTRYTTDELKVTKQTYISQSEVENLLKFLTSDEFLKLKKLYVAKRVGTDTEFFNTIHLQYKNAEKTIEIGHLENLSNPNLENFPDFPPILSDLYRQVNKIKSQPLKK